MSLESALFSLLKRLKISGKTLSTENAQRWEEEKLQLILCSREQFHCLFMFAPSRLFFPTRRRRTWRNTASAFIGRQQIKLLFKVLFVAHNRAYESLNDTATNLTIPV